MDLFLLRHEKVVVFFFIYSLVTFPRGKTQKILGNVN